MLRSIFDQPPLGQRGGDQKPRDCTEIDLGERLHRLRLRRQCSIAELAQITGVKARLLQKIEAGTTSPKISVLQPILSALGVGWGEFLAPQPPADYGTRQVNTLAEAGQQITAVNYQHRLLASSMLQKKMLPKISTLTLISELSSSPWDAHAGEAFVMVLEGAATLHSDDYETTLLAAGDSVYFDCTRRYRLFADQQPGTKVVWLTSLT